MDALSQVIELARIRGSLDLRCQMSGHFELDHQPLAPGQAPFHLVLSGRAQLMLPRGDAIELVPGDFILLPRGAWHVLRGQGVGPSRAVHMDHSGPLLRRSNTDDRPDMDILCGRFIYSHGSADLVMSALPDVLHVSLAQEGSLDALDSIVSLLRSEVEQLRSGALAIVTSLSHVLFIMALRIHAQRDGMSPSLLVLLGDSRLSRSVLAMIKEPGKAWTVEALARQANMSRATLARHFTDKAAMSPMDLVTDIRMQLACSLLETENSPLPDIAERVGYQADRMAEGDLH